MIIYYATRSIIVEMMEQVRFWPMANEDPNWDLAAKECRTKLGTGLYEEKADDGSNEIGEELLRRVRRGFTLKWIASDCSVCSGSGGKCGFNFSDYHFQCFCPDRPRAKHCVSDKSNSAVE